MHSAVKPSSQGVFRPRCTQKGLWVRARGEEGKQAGIHRGCLLWTEVQHTTELYETKKFSGFDQWAWRAIAEELLGSCRHLPQGSQTTPRDLLAVQKPHKIWFWCDSSFFQEGVGCRSQESPLLSSMGGREHVCVSDHSLAPCPKPLSLQHLPPGCPRPRGQNKTT